MQLCPSVTILSPAYLALPAARHSSDLTAPRRRLDHQGRHQHSHCARMGVDRLTVSAEVAGSILAWGLVFPTETIVVRHGSHHLEPSRRRPSARVQLRRSPRRCRFRDALRLQPDSQCAPDLLRGVDPVCCHNASICANKCSSIRNVMVRLIGVISAAKL